MLSALPSPIRPQQEEIGGPDFLSFVDKEHAASVLIVVWAAGGPPWRGLVGTTSGRATIFRFARNSTKLYEVVEDGHDAALRRP